DIKSGKPHIISLRQITTIMDRDRLNHLFGTPQPGYRYRLSPEALHALLKSRRWFIYGEFGADILCLLDAGYDMTAGASGADLGSTPSPSATTSSPESSVSGQQLLSGNFGRLGWYKVGYPSVFMLDHGRFQWNWPILLCGAFLD